MLRALFLDAAGTLITPAEPVADTYARILVRHGHRRSADEIGPAFAAAFKAAADPDYHTAESGDLSERKWWRRVVDATLGEPLAGSAFRDLFEHYARTEAWTVFPDVRPALDEAAELGLKLVVVSNFDLRLHRILDGHGLGPLFDHVVTSADARSRKPSSEIFHHALRRAGLAPHQVLHAGDSRRADLEGAAACGIRGFLLDRPSVTLAELLSRVRKLLVN